MNLPKFPSLAQRSTRRLAHLMSFYYSTFRRSELDYGQILGDWGALQAPHIIGFGPLQTAIGCIKIQARLKALNRIAAESLDS
jgi:hypothetical protein